MKAINTLIASLSYAHDKQIQDQIVRTLKSVDTDAEDVGFVQSEGTDLEVKELEARMDEFDERVATTRMRAQETVNKVEVEEGEDNEG